MLALDTLLGTAFGLFCSDIFPQYGIEVGTFAIVGMGATLFTQLLGGKPLCSEIVARTLRRQGQEK